MENGHLIVLGYGDVGKQVVAVLQDSDVRFVVVDMSENVLEGANFDYVIGNGADEEVLKKAGLENASTVIVTLSSDTDVIFATLISRGLNPESTILARANSERSIDKIYKAGADYVASLSIVAGQMLAKITATCLGCVCKDIDEDIMLYEGIDIEKHHVHKGSDLIGKSVAELDIRHTVGCTIIGIERDKKVITDIDPSIVIKNGDIMAVVGSKLQVAAFKKQYVK
ncbi:MAG TPA: potassium channel protein [Methanosarcinaceae archaeon]|nr:potassium channel protein [Methanosarcinaceae archaeon]